MSKFQHDVMLRVVKILNVLMIELPFAACWFLYYSHQTYANLEWEGHFAILGLFFILYIVLGKIYDAAGLRAGVRPDPWRYGNRWYFVHRDLPDVGKDLQPVAGYRGNCGTVGDGCDLGVLRT